LLHGKPGFLQVRDPGTLNVTASLLPGDPLAESFREEAEFGMLVLDPRIRRRMRINGRALMQAGAQLHVSAREVYANCPKYIQRREIVREEAPRQSRPMESSTFSEAQRQWIERADTFFIGSVHKQAGMDCSHRGGNPGFVRVKDDRRVVFADYSGNNMFQTLGNLSLDSRAALLFLDFETGGTLQVSGRAKIIWDEALAREWAGVQRLIEVEVLKTLEAASASPLRWRLLDYSPFNPVKLILRDSRWLWQRTCAWDVQPDAINAGLRREIECASVRAAPSQVMRMFRTFECSQVLAIRGQNPKAAGT
jgi:predicted pyridoxine 5'-phosphate oxidase superfamily flavin-nucleotide-binding protein